MKTELKKMNSVAFQTRRLITSIIDLKDDSITSSYFLEEAIKYDKFLSEKIHKSIDDIKYKD